MRNSIALFLVSLIVYGTCHSANGAEFDYEITGIPDTGGSCHSLAAEIATRLAGATGIAVTHAHCLAPTAEGWRIRVRYRAEKAIVPISNFTPYLLGSMGRFATLLECQTALPGLSAEFEHATGIVPLFSFCVRLETAYDYPWAPRIEGFGEARFKPYHAEYLFFSRPWSLTASEYEESVRQALESRGAIFSALVTQMSAGHGTAVVHYYASKPIAVTLEVIAHSDSHEQCQAQLAGIRSAYGTTKNSPAILYCGPHLLGNWDATALFVDESPLTSRDSFEGFSSYAQCEAERAGLLAYYRDVLKQDIRGGVCSRHQLERIYHVLLFEPKR